MRAKGLLVFVTTTLCSSFAVGSADAADVVTELELLRAFLEQPAQIAEAHAGDQLVLAAGAVAPWSPEPSFEARHEQNLGSTTAFRTNAVGGSVTLDISGKHTLLRKAGLRLMEGVGADVYHGYWILACDFRRGVFDVAYAEARLDTLQHRHDLLSDLVEIVEGLVAAGEVSPHDHARLRLQLSTHELEIGRAHSEMRAGHARLERRTGLNIGQIEMGTLPDLPEIGELRETVQSRHPGLKAVAERQAVAELNERAAKREMVPKIGLYGAYRVDSEPEVTAGSGFEAGVTIDLPWPGTNRPAVTAARAEQSVQKAEALQLRDELLSELEASYQRAQMAHDEKELQPPDLDGIWDASWTRYRAGEATVTELVDTLMSIEQQELLALDRSYEGRLAHLELSCAACVFFEPEIDGLMRETVE
jgi:outer membrane protein TolC